MAIDLIATYVEKIDPILPLAKRAYGSRDQDSPQHEASREYTRLLIEFQSLGGSLPRLAQALGVAYPGIRRRVIMQNVDVSKVRNVDPDAPVDPMDVVLARVLEAKARGTQAYHDQLAAEYMAGTSLAALSKAMKLSSSAPLYYGVQRSVQRHEEEEVD